jgi:hypothetical protein
VIRVREIEKKEKKNIYISEIFSFEISLARFLLRLGCKYQRSVIVKISGTLEAVGMSNEWDTLSKSWTILLKAARLLALSIHRLSATTSRIFLVDPPLFVALPSICRLVILNVGDKKERKREKKREREREKERGALAELEQESELGVERGS